MIRIKVPFSLEEYGDLAQVDQLPSTIKAWLSKVKAVNLELNKNKPIQEHHALIKQKSDLWRDNDLIEWMLRLSKDKCWYTEIKHGADYPEIEHFRPKKSVKSEDGIIISDGYYWLAFNLTNYRLCKPMPNRKKGSYFPILDDQKRALNFNNCHLDERPVFLDPLSPRDHMLLSFNDNGKAVPENRVTSIQANRVNFTVKHFGLNHGLLNRRRKEVWKTVRQLFSRYLNLTAQAEKSGSMRVEAKAEEALEQIMALIKPSAEFSSVAKASLNKTGDAIAIRIAASAPN
jgi:hypothetical protein